MVAKNTPSLPQNIDPNLRRSIEKQSESIDIGSGVRGNPDDRWIRIRDLVDMGLAKKLSKNAQALVSGVNLVSTVAPILDIPPTPEDFEVIGGLGVIFLNWKNARQIYSNHAYTEIWRAETNNLSNAVLIQQDASSFGSVDRNATYGTTYYYWIRFVSLADIKGPYNSAVGTLGKLAEDPAILLDMLEGEITATELHASLTSRIDLIDAPSTGLVAQSLNNANNIINESNARLSLAQQLRGDYTGSSLSGISTGLLKQEIVAREASINQLSSQMALLTAGSNTQFDTAIIWHFNTGVDGWSLGSVVGGFFRPTPGTNVTPVVTFPAVSGSQYSQVRMRIRRVGSPTTWVGHFQYTTSSGTNSTSFDAPTFEEDIAYLTRTGFGPWVNDPSGITSIGFRLYETTTSTDYYEIDWIAIGRPSPGASSAELFTEQQARISADSALASDIAIANAAIAGKASQSSVDTLTSRVTTAEGTLTTHGNKLTALDGQVGATSLLLNPNFAQWTNAGSYPDLWSAWDGTGLSQHTGLYAYSGGKAVQYSTNSSNNSGFRQDVTQNLDYLDFEFVFTLTSGSLSGAGLHVQWLNTVGGVFTADIALKDLYVPSEIYNKKIVCKARIKRPTGYTGTFSNLRIYVMANYAGSSLGALSTKTIIFDTVFASVPDASANAIQSLDNRVTSAEGSLSSQSSQITSLQTDVAGKASASALSALQSTVTSQGTTLSTHTSQITSLQTDVAGKASASVLSALDSRVTSTESVSSSQASAITQILASAPGGVNLIRTDTDFKTAGTSGWAISYNEVSGATVEKGIGSAFGVTLPYNINCLILRNPDYSGENYSTTSDGLVIPVEAGKRYYFGVRMSTWRASANVLAFWYNASGSWFATSDGNVISNSATSSANLSAWPVSQMFVSPPAGAVSCLFLVGHRPTPGLGGDPFTFFCRPMLCEVGATTTTTPIYSPSVSGAYAAISEEAAVRAATDGTIMASKVLKLDVNNKVAGWGAMNTGVESIMEFAFDKVLFYSPGNTSLVLAVSDGKVVMDGAFIKNATINAAQIANAAITDAHIANLNAVKLVAQSITTDKIEIGAATNNNQLLTSGTWQTISSSSINFDLALGDFVCTGAGVNIYVVVNVNFGALVEVFPPTTPSLTSTVESIRAAVTLKIDGLSKTSSAEIKRKSLINSRHGAVFMLPIVYREALTAGTRSFSINLDGSFFDASGNTVASSGKVLLSARALVQENKV